MSFAETSGTLTAGAIFTVLLIAAAVSDFRTRRTPNGVIGALALGGIAYSVETLPLVRGAGFAVGGLLAGLLIAAPFRYLRWLRGGDVKLASAAGAWLGSIGALHAAAAACVVSVALAGGFVVWQRTRGAQSGDLVVLLDSARRRPFALRIRAPADSPQLLPFGVAIALGALMAGWLR